MFQVTVHHKKEVQWPELFGNCSQEQREMDAATPTCLPACSLACSIPHLLAGLTHLLVQLAFSILKQLRTLSLGNIGLGPPHQFRYSRSENLFP